MNIAFFGVEDWQKEIIKKSFKDDKLNFFSEPFDEKLIPKVKNCEILSVFIHSDFTPEILDKFENLKAIVTGSTGFDHINVSACRDRGVLVCNVPKYGENTVAEQTFGLILSLSRKIPEAISRTREGNFSNDGLRGFDLKEKTIGVIGVGNIGQNVIKIANGFGMKVIAYDRNNDKKLAKKMGYKNVTINYLLKNSDFLTLHVPYNKSTHHLIGKNEFAKMKRGIYLINTARGGLVDTKELIKALNKGIVAGAGLDVLEDEELFLPGEDLLDKKLSREETEIIIENNILFKHKSVIITPHNAFNTCEALERILNTLIDNIKSIKRGKPQNLVN